jgi:hypothetical protein
MWKELDSKTYEKIQNVYAARLILKKEEQKKRRSQLMIRQGDRKRSILTGKVYEVKSIGNWSVVLESLDGSSQVLTEKDNLKLFYKKVEKGETPMDLDPSEP